ncbi:MAG TPA: HAD family hydrolase [Deinococcales bacterium]|nr:HAD family hydrolase [Deinococcales bacterium]
MIRLLLIDVDGTLVGQGARIHETVPGAFDRAREAGVTLALCTGRPLFGIATEYAKKVNPDGFHIFQNGAVISRADGTIGRVQPISRASYTGMLQAARDVNTPLEVYTPEALYLERHDDLTRRHEELLSLDARIQPDLSGLPGDVVRLQWVVPEERLEEVQGITTRFDDLQLNHAGQMDMPGVVFASVTRKGTTKTSAAEWLAGTLGDNLENVAMVGDGDGDRDLIGVAGLGIAMGNATEPVKAAAQIVVARVDDGGLAEAVDRVLQANRGSQG